MPDESLHLQRLGDTWILAGVDANQFALANEYLGYLADRKMRSEPMTFVEAVWNLAHELGEPTTLH